MDKLSPISYDVTDISIYSISFEDYVNLVVGDFHLLPQLKNVKEVEATNIKQRVMVEFAEIAGDYSFTNSISNDVKLMKLNLKMAELTLSYNILKIEYNVGVFDTLKEYGIVPRRNEYPKTAEDKDVLLEGIRGKLEVLKIDVAELEAEKERVAKEAPKNDEITRKPFIQMIASVSQFLEFNVSMDTNCAVVAEYIRRLRVYNEKEANKKLISGK